MHWDSAAILIVLGVVVPWVGRVRMKKLMARASVAPTERLALYASTIAFQWMMTAAVAWRAWTHGTTAQALGLTIVGAGRTASTAVLLTVALLAAQLIGLRQASRLSEERRGRLQDLAEKVLPQNAIERLAFAAVAATAGVCEEFIYRGYVFTVLGGGWRLAWIVGALGSAALFAVAHLYQGRRGIATTFVVGLLFAAARVLTGNLVSGVVAHTSVDLLGGLLAPRLLARPGLTTKVSR
jgi:uncharacterized protein